MPAQLVVFSGLPGVGKTALAPSVAAALPATYLRIDTIESAIASTMSPVGDNPVGYVVAGWVAADQLTSGRSVVADAVNNIASARRGWQIVARDCGVTLRFIEVTCSDEAEHRRRIETRTPEMPGHAVLSWEQVRRRTWEPFRDPRLTVDNIGEPDEHVAEVLAWLRES